MPVSLLPHGFFMKKIALPTLLAACLFVSAAVFAECDTQSITPIKPNSLYTDHNNGTVTDNETGLMWQKCTLGLSGQNCETGTSAELTWQAALELANSNSDFTYDDWRLPNQKELLSLVENSCRNPAINATVFPNTRSDWYWSSTPTFGDDNNTWGVGFDVGEVYEGYEKNSNLYVRLVRDSQ